MVGKKPFGAKVDRGTDVVVAPFLLPCVQETAGDDVVVGDEETKASEDVDPEPNNTPLPIR